MDKKNTLLVNLYAGPGAGKSTLAAYIFAKLKMAGVDSEYVSEYAKDRVWQEDQFPLQHCQLYITGKQCLKVTRLLGKVDVIVTDSPIMLGAMYTDEKPFKDVCIYEGKKYTNTFNIFINRMKAYNPNGRNQTEEEAKEIDKKIIEMLDENGVEYTRINGTEENANQIVNEIINRINFKAESTIQDDMPTTNIPAWKNVPEFKGGFTNKKEDISEMPGIMEFSNPYNNDGYPPVMATSAFVSPSAILTGGPEFISGIQVTSDPGFKW